MSDMDTTRFDGAACYCCGEYAVTVVPIVEGTRIAERALCGDCYETFVATCPDCEYRIWVKDGERLYASADLYCADCKKHHQPYARDLEQAAKADIDRDDFNIVGR